MASGSTAMLMDSSLREEAASDHAAPRDRRRALRCDLPPPAAPPYSTSVALLRNATSCFR
jgi:hypothetical protein